MNNNTEIIHLEDCSLEQLYNMLNEAKSEKNYNLIELLEEVIWNMEGDGCPNDLP